ncbi:hypothetical protein ERJ75_001664100 [Trypanosoma vivax]|uniref:Transmembrane protein n=1 Tax=Trypanosoma vivax (strain Y486) TaxID=1055687 RepID=G0U8G4_TRYVY|nr:hypothetical protein ERJ75_001664100 [Trypanosoma vivax]CCC53890.1 conserved hypothetical protein [Trypanosoma vivax Y486]
MQESKAAQGSSSRGPREKAKRRGSTRRRQLQLLLDDDDRGHETMRELFMRTEQDSRSIIEKQAYLEYHDIANDFQAVLPGSGARGSRALSRESVCATRVLSYSDDQNVPSVCSDANISPCVRDSLRCTDRCLPTRADVHVPCSIHTISGSPCNCVFAHKGSNSNALSIVPQRVSFSGGLLCSSAVKSYGSVSPVFEEASIGVSSRSLGHVSTETVPASDTGLPVFTDLASLYTCESVWSGDCYERPLSATCASVVGQVDLISLLRPSVLLVFLFAFLFAVLFHSIADDLSYTIFISMFSGVEVQRCRLVLNSLNAFLIIPVMLTSVLWSMVYRALSVFMLLASACSLLGSAYFMNKSFLHGSLADFALSQFLYAVAFSGSLPAVHYFICLQFGPVVAPFLLTSLVALAFLLCNTAGRIFVTTFYGSDANYAAHAFLWLATLGVGFAVCVCLFSLSVTRYKMKTRFPGAVLRDGIRVFQHLHISFLCRCVAYGALAAAASVLISGCESTRLPVISNMSGISSLIRGGNSTSGGGDAFFFYIHSKSLMFFSGMVTCVIFQLPPFASAVHFFEACPAAVVFCISVAVGMNEGTIDALLATCCGYAVAISFVALLRSLRVVARWQQDATTLHDCCILFYPFLLLALTHAACVAVAFCVAAWLLDAGNAVGGHTGLTSSSAAVDGSIRPPARMNGMKLVALGFGALASILQALTGAWYYFPRLWHGAKLDTSR